MIDHATCAHSSTRRAITACEAAAAPAPAPADRSATERYQRKSWAEASAARAATTAKLAELFGPVEDVLDVRPTEWHIG
jgi:hypothetical protein